MNKSEVSCEFGNIFWKGSWRKLHFLSSDSKIVESIQIIQYDSTQTILCKSPFLKNFWKGFQALINSNFFVGNLSPYKTGVKNIDQERPYKTIKHETSSNGKEYDYVNPYSYPDGRFSEGNKYTPPRSYIQRPYLDLNDINEVSLMQWGRKAANYFYFFKKTTDRVLRVRFVTGNCW